MTTIPEISVQELARKRAEGEEFILLDVREPYELERARLEDGFELVPMSELVQLQTDALPDAAMDKDAEIIVICHHGNRSGQVVGWLQQQGWNNVWNLVGGIDAYAREVDPSVGLY